MTILTVRVRDFLLPLGKGKRKKHLPTVYLCTPAREYEIKGVVKPSVLALSKGVVFLQCLMEMALPQEYIDG